MFTTWQYYLHMFCSKFFLECLTTVMHPLYYYFTGNLQPWVVGLHSTLYESCHIRSLRDVSLGIWCLAFCLRSWDVNFWIKCLSMFTKFVMFDDLYLLSPMMCVHKEVYPVMFQYYFAELSWFRLYFQNQAY